MPSLVDNPFVQLHLAQAQKIDPNKDPQKVFATLRKAADSSPTAQQATNVTPQASLDQILSKFDVSRIPLSRLKLMMRDPVLAFGLFFIKAQLQRARWMIESQDPQVAAFVDNALREIWPGYVSQRMLKHVYGYRALVKRFELTTPDWKYVDPNSTTGQETPVWAEGTIQALVWKSFIGLPPESVEPIWTPSGDFDGIHYKPGAAGITTAGAKEVDFDVLHCSPPDEPVLTTNRGYVAIEDLDDQTDKLVVWDKKQKRFCRSKGFEFKKGSRQYEGDLLTVRASGNAAARVTPNHKFTVRWTEEAQSKYSVYLMKKGDWWRVGITRVAREDSKSSGLGIRISAEGAEAAWVLGMFDSKNEALFHEKLWSNQYQIPDMVFQTSKWPCESQTEHCLTTEQVEGIWSQLDSASGARKLLADRQLDELYPFLVANDPNPRGTRGWTCHAVNMIDGLMEVPVDSGDERAAWGAITVSHEQYSGEVFSIEVPPHHHYVSNGVVTQNSLWVTNEKESVNGSLWGYPRLGYSYRFWWSFWFNWGLADRHFEKDADPPAVVYYPANKPPLLDAGGNEVSRRDIALRIGDSARSNSTIALPGDPVIGEDGTTKNMREWALEFPKGGGNFDAFAQRFDQLQVMMLRSIFVPEEAFVAKGGTAGYNSTGQLQDAFAASQIVEMQEMDYDVNRYLIPQLLMANFPDKVAQGITAKKVTKGFDTHDLDLAKIIIQGMANSNANDLNLDIPSLLDAVGLPRMTIAEIKQKEAENAAKAQQFVPDPTQAKQGPGTTQVAGVNQQGLYYAPREVIDLGESRAHDAEAVFLAELTAVGALADPVILSDASRIRTIWNESIKFDLAVANNLLHDYGTNLDLDETFFERFWRRVTNRAHDTAAHTRRALAGIMRRASTREMEKAGLTDFSWDPSNSDAASRYLSERGASMVTEISNTTREQIRTALADMVQRKVPIEHMPDLLRSHFAMLSEWRSDRIVRTEVTRAYNMATLLAAEDAGVKQVQAIDAQLGPDRSDPECIARNGRIFSIEEAFAEQEKEHPNGTLQWRILRKPIKVKRAPVPAGAPFLLEDSPMCVTVTMGEGLSPEWENGILLAAVSALDKPAEPETADIAVGDKVQQYWSWMNPETDSMKKGTVLSSGEDEQGDYFHVEWEDGTSVDKLRRTELRKLDTQSF